MKLEVAKWGDGLAVRLPDELVRRYGLRGGDSVEAHVTVDGALVIRPIQWSRQAFAAELAAARTLLPMGPAALEELRKQARY